MDLGNLWVSEGCESRECGGVGDSGISISSHIVLFLLFILLSSFVAHEKGDRPPSLKGRRPVMSTVEMFLWRNYLIFLSCTAPPSTSLQASLMSSGDGWVWLVAI